MGATDTRLDALAVLILDEYMEELVGRIVTRVHAFGGGYADIPSEDLAAMADVLAHSAIRALAEQRGPTEDELAQAAYLGERRARQGVPLEDVLRGIGVGAREALDLMRDIAARAGIDAGTMIAITVALWDWLDAASLEITQAHRRVELAHARRDQQQRVSFVHGLVTGTLGPHRIDQAAAAFGLDPAAPHVVVALRPSAEHPAEELERLLLPSTWSVGMAAMVGEDLVAVLAEPPSDDLPVAVGVGPAVPLSALSRSFRDAGRALETAVAFDLVGSHRLDDLVLRAVVLGEDRLGDILVQRYVTPVHELGPFGEDLLLSLRTFMAHDLNVEAAARALFVHPNTLRHRLGRFEETTGANLRSAEHLAEVWWALARDERATT
ncbi:MAG: helix-turn-helix domain-containing protein [Solirubrobacteraceae bacterium]|nr:helix-turn-helix domain-containing protein [Solirubrobacteraceae bacterium]